jgi:16S rRNA pseudouridine516 synthase
MQLQDILYSQGFGTRRVCAGLVQQGHVQVYMEKDAPAPVTIVDSAMELEATGLRFSGSGCGVGLFEKAYVVLNKPAGTECSQKPSTYPSIYTTAIPLRLRPQKVPSGCSGRRPAGPGHHRSVAAQR